MRFLSYLLTLLFAVLVAACGGGGGSPGAVPGQQPAKNDPILTLAMQDSAGTPTNSVGATGSTLLLATVTDPSGMPIPNQVVDVSGEASKVVFPEGNTALTNASGVAIIKLARASLVATGAGSLTGTYTYKAGSLSKFPNGNTPPSVDTVVTASIGYQLSASNIALTNLDIGAATLAAYGTRQVTVQANINGAPAAASPISVTFTASCGQILPSTGTTNSSGVVAVSYTATDAPGSGASTQGCGGQTVQISASTAGALVVSKSLSVTPAPATNMSFVGVNPSRIFLANSGGPTQAIAEFKLVDANGAALSGQSIKLALKTLNGGVPKATLGSVGNIEPVTLVSDAGGKVAVPVFSGSVPTSVIVNASLVSNPLVQTDSSILTIASGRPAQDRVSLALEKLAIEGANIDGVQTAVTLSLADRQGNPVPDGTAVNFVTEGGVMIPPVCNTGGTKNPTTGLFSDPGNSRCTVQIRSQNPRSANGRISILAYVAGEEDFVDSNFNNVYDCGEGFNDLGTATRDDNENGAFDSGEFSVPRDAAASACAASSVPTPSSGDGVWGAADVRKQAIVIFSTSQAAISGAFQPPVATTTTTGTGTATSTITVYSIVGLDLIVADLNGNSVATGSTIQFTAVDRTADQASCAMTSATSYVVPNSLAPMALTAGFKGCTAGDIINVKVTSPSGLVTSRDFVVP
ncbi:MAG: hypothetical protein NDJ19_04140 [Ramlibacter sp.]|nr:hypothetical protein [Ramlibacter sp.]